MSWFCTVALLAATSAGISALPADLNGTWHLNVERSRWGKRPRPLSVTLQINHQEPRLSYTGVVVYVGEGSRPFDFSGVINGRPYPMLRSYGSGMATLTRLNSGTFQTVFRAADGKTVETSETSVSRDGLMLVRHIRLRCPEGLSESTEIYERR